jgi:hypothetical protein
MVGPVAARHDCLPQLFRSAVGCRHLSLRSLIVVRHIRFSQRFPTAVRRGCLPHTSITADHHGCPSQLSAASIPLSCRMSVTAVSHSCPRRTRSLRTLHARPLHTTAIPPGHSGHRHSAPLHSTSLTHDRTAPPTAAPRTRNPRGTRHSARGTRHSAIRDVG